MPDHLGSMSNMVSSGRPLLETSMPSSAVLHSSLVLAPKPASQARMVDSSMRSTSPVFKSLPPHPRQYIAGLAPESLELPNPMYHAQGGALNNYSVLAKQQPSPVDHNAIMQLHYKPQLEVGGTDLPPAYGNYTYGHRDTWWSRRVPVHEHNAGIMINAEFPMQENQFGREIVRDDLAIRNLQWRHMGHWVPPAKTDQDADWKRTHTVEYDLAHDLKRNRQVPDFQKLSQQRRTMLGYAPEVDRNDREIELLDDQQLAEFLADPEAAIESSIYW